MGIMKSLFGGGDKKSPIQQVMTPPQVSNETGGEEKDKKKRLMRGLLISTSPEGDLNPVLTGRRKLLGN